MELSTRNWSIQYDALKKRIQTQRIKGIAFTQDDIRLIEGQLKLLDTQLKTMSIKSFEFELAPSETARRELLIENLSKVIINFSKGNNSSNNANVGLNNKNNNTNNAGYTGTIGNSSSSSSALKGSSNNSSIGNGNGKLSPTSSSYGADVSNPLSMKDRSLTLTNEIMKKQDEMVLEIGLGVERLHNKALVIGEEAKAHTRLLENFDSNIEIATAALQEEAKHAAEIKEKGKVCYMYICIVVEVLVLLLLIIIAFGTR